MVIEYLILFWLMVFVERPNIIYIMFKDGLIILNI